MGLPIAAMTETRRTKKTKRNHLAIFKTAD
jgi:hypothetical protein